MMLMRIWLISKEILLVKFLFVIVNALYPVLHHCAMMVAFGSLCGIFGWEMQSLFGQLDQYYWCSKKYAFTVKTVIILLELVF